LSRNLVTAVRRIETNTLRRDKRENFSRFIVYLLAAWVDGIPRRRSRLTDVGRENLASTMHQLGLHHPVSRSVIRRMTRDARVQCSHYSHDTGTQLYLVKKVNENKKFELMLTRRAKPYNSSGSVV